MDRLEVRDFEYFAVLARTLHFGRAADELGITQPPLSRAISRMERRLGVLLLERTSRQVSLTEAGRVFLRDSHEALASIDRAMIRARRTTVPARLVIAARSGTGAGVLASLLTRCRQHPAAVPVDVMFTNDQAAALRDGSADLAMMCGTDVLEDLTMVDVAEELPVALLPASHPRARHRGVALAEMQAEPNFSDRCPPTGFDEIVDRVALEELIVVVGNSMIDRLPPSIVAIPVIDMPPTRLVLAWPRNAMPSAIRDWFTDLAALPTRASGVQLAVPGEALAVTPRSVTPTSGAMNRSR